MNTDNFYNVLFLCTGNSARSVLAEAILNKAGQGRFKAYSAGSMPTGTVNLFAVELLANLGYPTHDLKSKSWSQFAQSTAPQMDFIFTVCDNAAGEVCPIWPGKPASAHWGIPDPAAATGSNTDKMAAFQTAYEQMSERIEKFLALPIAQLEAEALSSKLREIGA